MRELYDEFAEFLRARPDVLMQFFVRGQRAKLDQLSPGARRFRVAVQAPSASVPVFDFVCFGLDAQGKLADDRYMVFFNQQAAPGGAITLEELADQSATFQFDLDALPAHIERLVFTISIDGTGAMSGLGASELVLSDAKSDAKLMSYKFSGADFNKEGALMLAEVYRKAGEWRAWASGQGFAGSLGALLTHFGGEVAEENAPAPTVPATVQSPPSPPISSPAVAWAPVGTPAPVVIPAAPMGELQKTLDGAPDGATIRLPRGEYRGPITIARPLTIEGEGAVIWAQSGPVVAVTSGEVTLREIQIEVTGDENGVALHVEGTAPTLSNVGVRGRVVGVINEAAGEWKLPASLDLGEFAPRALNSWKFEVEVPVGCRLKVGISGLQIKPSQIGAGKSGIEIIAQGIGPDTFLAGQIEVEHAGLVRPIPLSGRAASADKSVAAVQNKRI